jgi:hypothetical protein
MMHYLLEENKKAAVTHRKKKDKSPFRGSEPMQVACKTYERFMLLQTRLASKLSDTTNTRRGDAPMQVVDPVVEYSESNSDGSSG